MTQKSMAIQQLACYVKGCSVKWVHFASLLNFKWKFCTQWIIKACLIYFLSFGLTWQNWVNVSKNPWKASTTILSPQCVFRCVQIKERKALWNATDTMHGMMAVAKLPLHWLGVQHGVYGSLGDALADESIGSWQLLRHRSAVWAL